METPQIELHYSESHAQRLLKDDKIDELVIYCIPTVYAYLHKHKWAFVTTDNYYDTVQDLTISMMDSIKRYNDQKDTKLLSWIITNYRYTCLAIAKKEKKFIPFPHAQLISDDISLYYEMKED